MLFFRLILYTIFSVNTMIRKSNKGFTLIEILIVMSIIAVLIAIALVGVGAAHSDSRNSNREITIKAISASLERYYNQLGQTYPLYLANDSQSLYGYSPVDSANIAYYNLGINICSSVIDPSTSGYDSSTHSCYGTPGSYSPPWWWNGNQKITITYPSLYYLHNADYNNSTFYFYIPFANGSPVINLNYKGIVDGYVLGACLENHGIFAVSSNNNSVNFTQNAAFITLPNGVQINCNIQ